MAEDRLSNITYLNQKARAIVKAAAELMQADTLISPEDLGDRSTQKKLQIWDVLRTHDTCGYLLFSLMDICDSIDAELDAAEVEEMAAAQAKKPAGIQDTEMLCTAICPQRMKPDGIQTEKRTPPETCAEPQKKGKSGGAQK